MDLIAQIEGVQDIILRKLPSSNLPRMLTLSREWVGPSNDRIRQKLAQLTNEFTQELGEETGVNPTARGKFGWKREGFLLQPTPDGHGWTGRRCYLGYMWGYAIFMGIGDWPVTPRNPPKIIKLLRNLLFTNCRSGSHILTQKHAEYRHLCVKQNIYRPHITHPDDKWSHTLYRYGDALFQERLQLELKREKLVKLFRIALPKQCHQYYINNFAKATRPDLMFQRLLNLTHILQKT